MTVWWDRAAEALTRHESSLRRFGFITTNSITQTFSRRVLEHHLEGRPPMRLVFAIPDHPWLKGGERAAVRIAMTVAEAGDPDGEGRLLTVVSEQDLNTDAPRLEFRERRGTIQANLRVGETHSGVAELKANAGLCSPGVKLHGAGFLVTRAQANAILAPSNPAAPTPIHAYRNGRDLADRPRGLRVIDLFGWDETDVRRHHPGVYQHLLETVKPERDRNNRATYRENWWVFGEARAKFRPPLADLERYIATPETAKHRWFTFLPASVMADNMIVAVASDDARILGVLNSRTHRTWAYARGGRMGVGNDLRYNKGPCFDSFPFPELEGAAGAELGVLAKELDALRARVLDDHPDLTLTGLYNVRERVASGENLTDAERAVSDRGLVRVLDHLHRRIDEQTRLAYGWATHMDDEATVAALMRLNRDRIDEEGRGVVRFLRPAYQAPRVPVAAQPTQVEADLATTTPRPALPDAPDALASALLTTLRRTGAPIGPEALADRFEGRTRRARTARVREMLAVLCVAGSVQKTDAGWFAAVRRS